MSSADRTVIVGRLWRTSVLLAALVLRVTESGAQTAADSALVEGLVAYLGVAQEQREALRNGETVTSGVPDVETRDENISAAGGLLLTSGVSARALVEAFLEPESSIRVHAITSADATTSQQFLDIELDFPDGIRAVIREPDEYFNLASQERDLLAAIDAEAVDAEQALLGAFRQILGGRLADHWAAGLNAGRPYLRAGEEGVLPTQELRAALDGMSVLRGVLGPFLDDIGAPVAPASVADGTRRLFWVQKTADDRKVIALTDQHLYFDDALAVASEMHFYVSSTYNAVLTIVGAAPVRDEMLLFVISHTFTDRVTGLGSGLRHRVARGMVSDNIGDHLDRVRARLEAND